MTYDEYQRRVLARVSKDWHGDKMDTSDLMDALNEFIEAGNRLDRVKKSLFYGRDFEWEEGETPLSIETPMPTPELQQQHMIHAILGLATEGVELVEAMQKMLAGQEVDVVNLQEEFGDAEWYRALGLFVLEQTHEANLRQNDAKLEKRFGPAFSRERANARDLEAERKTLEG